MKISWLKGLLPLLLLALTQISYSQSKVKAREVKRIIQTLAADDMEGRKTFEPGIAKASEFLETEFKKAGLQPLPGATGYRQEFHMAVWKPGPLDVKVNGQAVAADKVIMSSYSESVNWTDASPVKVMVYDGENSPRGLFTAMNSDSNTVIWVGDKYAATFKQLKGYLAHMSGKMEMETSQPVEKPSAFMILQSGDDVENWSISLQQEKERKALNNVVGIIPGTSKANEMVVFSGHYDHLGIVKSKDSKDSIANGADDDASGVTAVVTLANYYKNTNPARTLVFVAFTAEEIGGFGSKYFSMQLDPAKVVAMFNIEMIGKESKFGRNSAFITGYERSDFGKILQENLKGSQFEFHPDPYPEQNLFYRSDNATLAKLGVPAHTISTTQIDKDKLYHSVGDEVSTLDIQNITDIINAIATSARSIVDGVDTPARIDPM